MPVNILHDIDIYINLFVYFFQVLPAAALTKPIFSRHRPQYLNYGALGVIIGHELVHGFGIMDSVKYGNGEEDINWSNSTFHDFFEATECLLSDCNQTGDENDLNVRSRILFFIFYYFCFITYYFS